MEPRQQQKEALFEAARHLSSSAERAAYLDRACGHDPELRRELDAMLQVDPAAQAYFQTADLPAEFWQQNACSPPAPSDAPLPEGPGTLIGRYKLLEQIGEGGFGVVYMAEQQEPVIRKVALKIIKLGLDTREVVVRFEAERQALALMDHPNIAQVFDGGATETGRPYFVMELVQGIPITEFADENTLPTAQRLTLFAEVCSAIQHAHQKGVIHRDLKPSNILVTLHGDKPVPKVIDFGIAKATQQRLTEKTVFTRFQQFIGTPAYMSPEQASLSGLDVDTRSDIYSLGVLLYELLTSRTPFDARVLRQAGYEEIRRIIREEDPPPPSIRLSTLRGEERTTVARARQADPRRLGGVVRGELDWIVMKALEKDRTRRYETANALALDIYRFLRDEPVTAVAPSARYRIAKFARRNRTALAIAAGFVLLMLGATLLSGWFALRMNQARKGADDAAEKAREEADISKAINRFWNYEILGAANPFQGKRLDITVREAMNIATEKVGEKYAHRPAVEIQIRSTLANSYRLLGDHVRAKDQYQRLLELQTRILGDEGYKEVVRLLLQTADNCRQLRDYAAAELYVDHALAVVKAHQAQDSLLTAHCQEILAGVYFHRFEPAKMLEVMLPAVRRLEADRASPDVDLGSAYHNLGVAYHWLERKEEALHWMEKGRERKAQRQPQGIALGRSLLTLAADYYPLERYEEADALVARALDLYDVLTGRNHYDLYSRSEAPVQFWARQSQFDQAEQFLQEAREFLRTYRYTNSYDLTANLVWTAEFCQARTRFTEAEGILTNLLLSLDPHSDPFYGYSDPTVRGLASSVYAQQEKWGAAREVFSQIYRPNAEHWWQRALLELQTGDEPAYRETCQQLLQQFAGWDDRYALTTLLPTLALRAQTFTPNQTDTLRRWQRRLAEHPAILGPATEPRIHLALGMIAYRLGQFPEAIVQLKCCLKAPEHYRGLAELFLAVSYDQLQNRSQALDFFRRAEETMNHLPQPGSGNLGRHWMQVVAYHLLKKELKAGG